jgi:NMD protein affecting ribosome stability and mRNA decay
MLPPIVIDIYRDTFTFYLRNAMIDDALTHTAKLVTLYEAMQTQSSAFKTLFSVTILLLSKGDVVSADHTYLQEHLNNAQYISSRECALAEDFITAFKNYDSERLAVAQASSTLHFMDREIIEYARRLSLFTAKTQEERVFKKLSHEMESMTVGGVKASSTVVVNDTDDPFDENGDLKAQSAQLPTIGQSTYHDTGDDEIDLT